MFIFSFFSLPSLHILGNVGSSFQMEFFTFPALSEEIAGSVFVSLDHIPDYRLRPIIHILGHVLNFFSIRYRCCAKRAGISLMSITILCEEFGAVLSSGILWQCALPPAGPSLHLHAAGQDPCAGHAWNLNYEFTQHIFIFCFLGIFLSFSLFFSETQCQVAGHQPEDISKVSTKSFWILAEGSIHSDVLSLSALRRSLLNYCDIGKMAFWPLFYRWVLWA